MTPPWELSSWGAMLYERFAPLAYADEANGWALAALLDAIGRTHQPLHDLISDSDGGPGWSSLLDVDRCPVEHLPHLAQYVGERLPAGLSEADARERIRYPQGFVRGTRQAMINSAQRTLTGTKFVSVLERTSSAYTLTVITRTAETANATETNRVLQLAKPAGLVLTHIVTDETLVDEGAGTVDAAAGTVNAA